MRIRIVINPKAGSGSAARKVPEITRRLQKMGVQAEVVATAGPGDAARLAERARADGVECVAVVGGDGTLNEVSQAYLTPDGEPTAGPDLALIPAGTGGDFRKTFELGTDLQSALERITSAPARLVDLGIVRLTAHSGEPVTRSFLNIASFGLSGLTDRIVDSGPKWMGGRAAFFLGALRALAVYRNSAVSVDVDGEPFYSGPVLSVVLANCRYFGGGMFVAPEADPSDGLLDVVVIGDLTRPQAVGLSGKIYRGAHLGQPGVHQTRGRSVEARLLTRDTEVLIDLDGEAPGRLPLSARIVPGAIRMRI